MRIQIVEDDRALSDGIRLALREDGITFIQSSSVRQAKEDFGANVPDIVILDINLPDGSGYDFCKWVKEREDTPVIFLTVCDDVKDITRGLDMGADDYVTKPFHIAVLESRIAAVLRRTSDDGGNVLSCGNIQLDREKMQVMVDGQSVDATALEYRLLEVLMENKGRTLPRNLILDKLWDTEGNFVNDNTLTVTVKRLRRKLMDTGYIVTIRGIGYRMEEKI